jgi:HprK-related kinase A
LILADLSHPELEYGLKRGELLVQLSPFVVRVRTSIAALARALSLMYADFPITTSTSFADFHVEMARGAGLRRWMRPQVNFIFDGIPSFQPLPANHAYPMFEWGLNWCIASHSHQFLIIHAAVIERNGMAAIMPAPPGSGKSTLCAGLVSRGWRLLSDELTLVDMKTGLIQPMSRPINLKNQSIDVIRRFQPDAVITEPVADTKKGTVALLRPPAESVRRITEPARPAWIIFPKYLPDAPASFSPYSKAHTCLRVAQESFNYDIHGRNGFDAITRLIEDCNCYEFSYGNLEDAVREFSKIAAAPS